MKKLIFFLVLVAMNIASQDFWAPTSSLSPSNNDFVMAINVSGSGSVIAGSWNVGVFRSTNNGNNWSESGLTGLKVYRIVKGPGSTLFAMVHTNSGPKIYRSTDDGLNWNQVFFAQHSNNYFYGGGMVFIDNNIAVASLSFTLGPTLGDIGVEIARSTNGGESWQSLGVINGWGGNSDLLKLNDGRILAATSLSGVWYSTNNGGFWQQVTSFPPFYTNYLAVNSNGVIFVGHNTAANAGEMLFRSTDNGSSWQGTGLLSGGNGGNIKAVYIDNDDNIYVSFYITPPITKKIYRSSDNGITWQDITGGMPSAQLVYSLTGNSQNIIFAGTQSNGVYKSLSIVPVKENNTSIPEQFGLTQNYPNPFNPKTNIKYQIPNISFVRLIIYDITGKEVLTLVNQKQNAGTYEVDFSGLGYSSGVYFYKIIVTTTKEAFTETRKMILIK